MDHTEAPHPRIVHCEDALTWLRAREPLAGCSLVASLPDISEFPSFSLDQWKAWFIESAALILSRTPPEGVTVFYQSDIKLEGRWVDKAFLCQKAAESQQSDLLWHKIVCRLAPGQASFGRPAYSHILCFSKQLRCQPQNATADVLAHPGDKTWERGMGLQACLLIAKFIAEHATTRTVVNPFCGQGSMLASAEALGLTAIGIERSPKRAQKARGLKVDLQQMRFCS